MDVFSPKRARVSFGTDLNHMQVYKQNRRQKIVNRGSLRSCAGVWHSNLTKIPLICSVSYFNWGGLGVYLGELRPPNPPWRRGLPAGLETTPSVAMHIVLVVLRRRCRWLLSDVSHMFRLRDVFSAGCCPATVNRAEQAAWRGFLGNLPVKGKPYHEVRQRRGGNKKHERVGGCVRSLVWSLRLKILCFLTKLIRFEKNPTRVSRLAFPAKQRAPPHCRDFDFRNSWHNENCKRICPNYSCPITNIERLRLLNRSTGHPAASPAHRLP